MDKKTKTYEITVEVFDEEEPYSGILVDTDDINGFISAILVNGIVITTEDGNILGLSPASISKVIVEPDKNDTDNICRFHSKN